MDSSNLTVPASILLGCERKKRDAIRLAVVPCSKAFNTLLSLRLRGLLKVSVLVVKKKGLEIC